MNEELKTLLSRYKELTAEGESVLLQIIKDQDRYIQEARADADKLVDAIHLYNTDATKALKEARREGEEAGVRKALEFLKTDEVEIFGWNNTPVDWQRIAKQLSTLNSKQQ
jgi:hypothetical protein